MTNASALWTPYTDRTVSKIGSLLMYTSLLTPWSAGQIYQDGFSAKDMLLKTFSIDMRMIGFELTGILL